ncbi:hypothetical protein EYF80_034426 [Liparis tanakae]|uniref:Uncharacterized protein n=1 Tax=Liparis tanakae TaxID=230148 RepID=A0A4Z2GRF3_9TELE|nr:hypothetical protein EYF80_034426 [Liparis tanakae]
MQTGFFRASPLTLVMVQFLRTSEGRWASSKAKGPALGFRSPSSAVMLMALGSGFWHTSVSCGNTLGAFHAIQLERLLLEKDGEAENEGKETFSCSAMHAATL